LTRQETTVAASNFFESHSTFQTSCNFQFVRLYLRNYDGNLWHWCQNSCFGGISRSIFTTRTLL